MGLKWDEFKLMTWGEYAAKCEAYRNKRISHLHDQRTLLGAILREQPKKLYYLPGDHDGMPKPMTKEQIEERIKKLGNKEVMKLHKING